MIPFLSERVHFGNSMPPECRSRTSKTSKKRRSGGRDPLFRFLMWKSSTFRRRQKARGIRRPDVFWKLTTEHDEVGREVVLQPHTLEQKRQVPNDIPRLGRPLCGGARQFSWRRGFHTEGPIQTAFAFALGLTQLLVCMGISHQDAYRLNTGM
jgi:hypothetical protein